MRFSDPRPRHPRRRVPLVDGLETRELMSASSIAGAAAHTSAAQLIDSPLIQKFANLLYGPNSPTPMTPGPQTLRRQLFTAAWVGKYTVGPALFSDRASTIHAYAVTGGSNQFLKGKLNLALYPPADPSATPTPGNPYANQVTGIAGLFPENILQSGSMLVLDLNSQPAPGSDPHQLPTQLTWTYDSNASAGAYAAPEEFTQGAGEATIKWIPNAHPLPGTEGSGKMIIIFKGIINLSRVVNPISKLIM
jgi:hypothetical protein